MKINKLELETVCGITSSFPDSDRPEVAFWGRSNVGKSSLLNTLWSRKSMARTSSEPGKTQTINYYRVEFTPTEKLHSLYMVDLPGYGYAKTSKTTVEKWMKMINKYLSTSKALSGVFLLIDSRHDPTAADIRQFELLFRMGFNPIIVATKLDKLKKNDKKKTIQKLSRSITETAVDICKSMGDEVTDDFFVPVIGFSSATGEGSEALWDILCGFSEE